MSFIYHVTRQDNGSKKLITVSSKSDIFAKLSSDFDCSNFFLQYLTNVEGIGEVWLDVDDPCVDLPDRGKLLLVSKEASTEITSLPSAVTTHTSYEVHPPSLSASPSTSDSCTVQDTVTVSNGQKANRLTYYRLPKFPTDIQSRLDAKDDNIISDRSCRAKIIRLLYNDLLDKVGWYDNSDILQ